MRWRALLALGPVLASTLGCSQVLAPAGVVDARDAPFDECSPPYSFAQETTLEAIGLGELAGGPDANRRGMVWITANAITEAAFAPPGAPIPVGGERFGPVICIEYADGSGMSTILDGGWQPPADLASGGAADPQDLAGPAIALVGVLLLLLVSWLAFRRPQATAP